MANGAGEKVTTGPCRDSRRPSGAMTMAARDGFQDVTVAVGSELDICTAEDRPRNVEWAVR